MQKRLIFLLLAGALALVFFWNRGPDSIVSDDLDRTDSTLESAPASEESGGNRDRVPSGSARDLRFQLVSSYSGVPLASGKLTGHRDGSFEANEAGEIVIPDAVGFNETLVAECPGYSSTEFLGANADIGAVNKVELDPNFRITGQVFDLSGSPSPEGLLVVGFHGSRPSAEEFFEIGTGDAAPCDKYSFAFTDGNGEFEMAGLDPSYSYSLVAGGEGLISPNSRNNVIPSMSGDARTELQVAHTWGIQFKVVSEDGLPLRGNGQLFQGVRGVATRVEGAHGSYPLPDLPWMTMLGIHPRDLVPALSTVHKSRHVFFGKPLLENPKLIYTWTAPGYLDQVFTEELEPVVRGVREVQLYAIQDARAFGSVQVEVVESILDEVTGGTLSSPDLLVELYPMDEPYRSEDILYRTVIPCASNGVYEIDGIPYGNYQVGFMARNKLWGVKKEMRTIQISQAQETVQLSLGELGLARLDVLDEEGFELNVPVRTRFHRWGPEVGHHAFEYIRPDKKTVSMLSPGEYRFYPERPFPKGYEPVDPEGSIVRVESGQVVEVNLAFKAKVD